MSTTNGFLATRKKLSENRIIVVYRQRFSSLEEFQSEIASPSITQLFYFVCWERLLSVSHSVCVSACVCELVCLGKAQYKIASSTKIF